MLFLKVSFISLSISLAALKIIFIKNSMKSINCFKLLKYYTRIYKSIFYYIKGNYIIIYIFI